jgi:hypothetical protein
MISNNDFRTFYQDELSGSVEALEKYRYENAKKLKRLFFIAIFCIPILGMGILTLHAVIIVISSIPLFLFMGMAYQQYQEMNIHLRSPFKNLVLLKSIDFLFEQSVYIENQRIAKTVFEKSMLFPSEVSAVKGEDFMQFTLGKVTMMFCEAKVFSLHGRKLFSGLFLTSCFNKYFTCKTIVFSQKTAGYFHRVKKQLFHNMKRIQLEDPDFEKQFYTLSNNQVEARYILSTGLMKRILDYKAKTGRDISVSFADNRLYCAVPKYDDFFEVPFFKPLDFEFVKQSLAPVILYTDIVEDLNLNLRIWTKQ